MSFNELSAKYFGFPLEFPRDDSKLEELLMHIDRWALASQTGKLSGARLTLSPDDRLALPMPFPWHETTRKPARFRQSEKWKPWDFCKNGCGHFAMRTPRPRPAEFDDNGRVDVTVDLKEHISMPGTHFQLYKGGLDVGRGSDPLDVMVKIYQISLVTDIYQLSDWINYAIKNTRPGEAIQCNKVQGFRCDSYLYEQMASIQGSYVPHVYGFFKVRFCRMQTSSYSCNTSKDHPSKWRAQRCSCDGARPRAYLE